MAYCKSCSAPLLANTNRCQYCGVRNDVDLNTKHNYVVYQQVSDRICPHCDVPLQTIQLNSSQAIFLERCEDCFGLFFDLGELEMLFEQMVNHVTEINRAHIDNINIDRFHRKPAMKYIKCPVCREFMHRTNFAQKSGVIVDICRSHGLWLDSGEVTHLMEWKKVGGQLLHEQEQRNKVKKTQIQHSDRVWNSTQDSNRVDLEMDLLEFLVAVVRKLF